MKNSTYASLNATPSSQDILISKWLNQMHQDEIIDQHRGQRIQKGSRKRISNEASLDMQQLSQKLNRLQRNFLRDSDTKKEQKKVSSVNQSYGELDEIYKRVSNILGTLKDSQNMEEKDISSQMFNLYNYSVGELSKRNKLEKEVKAKKMQIDKIEKDFNELSHEEENLERELLELKAVHSIKMNNFERRKWVKQ